jgi:hypothetical protein
MLEMGEGVGIEGSGVVLMFQAKSIHPVMAREPAAARQFGPANDNGPREPAKTVTVRRVLEKSGVAIKIKVPVEEFIGVAVSTHISPEGVLSSAIELVHGDPDLNYRVFEEQGNSAVVAEWQTWGQQLRLPLYIRSGDGSLLAYSQHVNGVALRDPAERRTSSQHSSRRAQFMGRRVPGENSAS